RNRGIQQNFRRGRVMIIGFAGLTPIELLIILVLGVLLFGKKLPDLGRRLGIAIVKFKRFRRRSEPMHFNWYPKREDPPDSAPSLVPRRPKPPKDSGSVAKEIPPFSTEQD